MAGSAASECPPKDGGFYRCGMKPSGKDGLREASHSGRWLWNSNWRGPRSKRSWNSNARERSSEMEVYRVMCGNTQLHGERREYLVLAKNLGDAEVKAVTKMNGELRGEPGVNYAYEAALLGSLTK